MATKYLEVEHTLLNQSLMFYAIYKH